MILVDLNDTDRVKIFIYEIGNLETRHESIKSRINCKNTRNIQSKVLDIIFTIISD